MVYSLDMILRRGKKRLKVDALGGIKRCVAEMTIREIIDCGLPGCLYIHWCLENVRGGSLGPFQLDAYAHSYLLSSFVIHREDNMIFARRYRLGMLNSEEVVSGVIYGE